MNSGDKPIPKNKKQVLMVALFPPPYSSGERMVNITVKNILQKRYDVTAINFSAPTLSSFSFSFSKVKNQIISLQLFIRALFRIKKLLKKRNFDALYFVTPQSSLGHIRDWFLLKTTRNKIPYKFAFIHNGEIQATFQQGWHKNITRSFIDQTSFFVFLSKGLSEKSINIPAQKKKIIPNTVDPSIILTEAEINTKIKNFNTGTISILYLSNMTPTKGYMDAAYAIKIMLDKQPGSIKEANFVGEWLSSEDEVAFNDFTIKNGLQHVVKAHGKINNRDLIRQFYTNATIFLLPTYFSHEAQPLSIIEALSAGIPVIATDYASIPEYITDGYNGFLVNKEAPHEIAVNIEKLMDAERWKTMAVNARKSFEEKFSFEKYKERIFDLFELKPGEA